MFSDFSWLGILACVYALARLIHYAYLRLEDSHRHPFVQKVLIVFCIVLWFISAPVTLVMGIINTMHYRRLEDKVRMDCAEDPSSHDYQNIASVPLEIIAIFLLLMVIGCGIQNGRLESEIESLESQIEESEYERDRQYESGYDAGCDVGYDNGYIDGYDDGYDDGREDGYDKGYGNGIEDSEDLSYYEGFVYGYSGASADYGGAEVLSILTEIIKSCDSIEEVYESFVERRMLIFGRGDPGRE